MKKIKIGLIGAELLLQGVESRDIGRHFGEELIEIYER